MTKTSCKILVIDDDNWIREVLRDFLSGKGFEVDVVNNGSSALNTFKTKEFDLVLVDLKMPGMSGIEVLKSLKQLDADVIVIIMTGYASLETAMQAIKEGAYDYLTKPFQLDELEVAVQNACEKVMLRRQQRSFVEELRAIHRKTDKQDTALARLSLANGSGQERGMPWERLSQLIELGLLSEEEVQLVIKNRLKGI
ncbi:MAG: sigma-54-dependent Fis family transcriptional regulator [Deltaproteobacteria bacterium]|nr:sigma-54-dependent Fis family transcriptional regulator [Deltaproteobacteria bacterium]